VSRLKSGLIDKVLYSPDEMFGWIAKPLLARFIPIANRSVEEMAVKHFLDALCFYSDRFVDAHFRSQVALLSGAYDHVLTMEDDQRTAAFFAERGIPLHTSDRHAINKERLEEEPIVVDPDTLIQHVRVQVQSIRARTTKYPAIVLAPELQDLIAAVAEPRFALDLQLWRDTTDQA
jgi:hypothetical protein